MEKYFFTGLMTESCTGGGVCASWGVCVGVFILGFKLGCPSWGASLCVQVGVFRWDGL
jgi:hypothetical protein